MKKKTVLKYAGLVGVLFLFPISLVLFFAKGVEQHFYTLPYFDPSLQPDYQFTPPVDSFPNPTDFHQVPDFNLTSHKGLPFTQDSLEGKVWLVSFYSTQSEYVKSATKRLLEINWHYRNETDIGILCLTLNAEKDTPEVLGQYIDEVTTRKVNDDKWYFLTGDQTEINSLIEEGFLIQDTTNIATMWLVDLNKNLRGRYNGNFGEEMKRAKEDIALLQKEIDARKPD